MEAKDRVFQIVHYLVPDTWELEELYPSGDVGLAESDVPSEEEFGRILKARGLAKGPAKRPYNSKMELFEAVRV